MSKKSEVGTFVKKKIDFLQTGSISKRENAMLANLRRGIGREPGELPQLFGIVLLDMPENFMSTTGIATNEEWACYTALTLYALHQQGHDSKSQPMHIEEEISIGRAMSKLAAADGDSNAETRLLQRLQTIATSLDRKELAYHLRSMVQLLRSRGIALNYVMLAEQLYELQYPEGKTKVCLKWGQDFYRKKEEKNEEE